MGVSGLWKLIDSSGQPIPVEALEHKVLAVDISIWLHQLLKGYEDNKSSFLPNAHLLGLFHRLCKLLYYRVKPIFIFDGCVPQLKLETIARRQQQRNKLNNEANRIQALLLESLAKEKIVQQALGGSAADLALSLIDKQIERRSHNENATNDDIFKLPELPQNNADSEDFMSSSSEADEDSSRNCYNANLHMVDVRSKHFNALPAEMRYEILVDIKETRKQSSWGRLHELPHKGDDFSSYQMKRLLKRRAVQESMEKAEQEMGGRTLSYNELANYLAEENLIDSSILEKGSRQISSDENTRFLLVRDLKNKSCAPDSNTLPSITEVKEENCSEADILPIKEEEEEKIEDQHSDCGEDEDQYSDCEEDEGLQLAIAASLETCKAHNEEECEIIEDEQPRFTSDQKKEMQHAAIGPARAYMIEYGEINSDAIRSMTEYNGETMVSNCEGPQMNETSGEHSGLGPIAQHQTDNLKKPLPDSSIDGTDAIKDQETYVLSSDSDSDFEDVPEIPKDSTTHLNATDIDKKGTNEIEEKICNGRSDLVITVDISKSHGEEDIFSDLFKNDESITQPICAKNSSSADDVAGEHSKSSPPPILEDQREQRADDELKSNHISPLEAASNEKTEHANTSNLQRSQISLDDKKQEEKGIPHLESSYNRGESFVNDSNMTSLPSNDLNESSSEVLELEEQPIRAKGFDKPTTEDLLNDAATALKAQKSTEELTMLAAKVAEEKRNLENERNRQDRMGMSINQRMNSECQELLRLFGIPYLIAPMEAEAQCAFLDAMGLTNGTITDDSDIWLFGARTVYKNFFAQKKHVLEFQADNIEKSFNCNRTKLIEFACLVGSDYTTGIHGIGPVTAMEILASFSPKTDPSVDTNVSASLSIIQRTLEKFRDWWSMCQRQASPVKGNSRHLTLLKKLKNIQIRQDFPNRAVINAYLYPEVDNNVDNFSWSIPDVELIREFTKKHFGWTQTKTDTILMPVLKKCNEKTSQPSIKRFFKTKKNSSSMRCINVSKRVQDAISNMLSTDGGDVQKKRPKLSKLKVMENGMKPRDHRSEAQGKHGNDDVAKKNQ